MNKHEYKRDHNETLIREGRNTIVSFSHPDEHHVIAEVHQEAVGAGSGVPVEMTLYYLFDVRNSQRPGRAPANVPRPRSGALRGALMKVPRRFPKSGPTTRPWFTAAIRNARAEL